MPASSSSPKTILNSKPLNPLALSFKPAAAQTNEENNAHFFANHEAENYHFGLCFPQSHFSSYFMNYTSYGWHFPTYNPSEVWDYKVESLNLYIPGKQQSNPSINIIPYDGIQSEPQVKFRHLNKSKCRFVPPRLRQPLKDFPVRRLVYVPKERAEEKMKADLDHNGKTSLMIKNIPNHLRRSDLLGMLDKHCRAENKRSRSRSSTSQTAYDFLYLPMDFGFDLNLGFAFVNFTTSAAASRFYQVFSGTEWACHQSRHKVCEVTFAKIQGSEGLKQQFHKSSFPCKSDEYLPVLFSPSRNGFNYSRPILVGRRTHFSARTEKVMIMAQRKNKKKLTFCVS